MSNWKTIPNFSGYEASTDGKLRSKNYKRTGKAKELKPALQADGYLQTMIKRDDAKYISGKVHRFVAMAFLGQKPKGYEVNHIDCNKLNNSPSNLEYVTKSENIKHAYRNNLITPKVGSSNGMAKLTEQDVLEIRQHAENGGRYYGRKELATKYGVSECTIKEVVCRRKNKFYNA